jgi:predicted dithiol-disulfide oxidoreductase (DUF899 family)
MITRSADTGHRIGTRSEWLAARLSLLEAEKEHTQRGDELARMRQELPWVRIEKVYQFETDDGNGSTALLRGAARLATGGVATTSTTAAAPVKRQIQRQRAI